MTPLVSDDITASTTDETNSRELRQKSLDTLAPTIRVESSVNDMKKTKKKSSKSSRRLGLSEALNESELPSENAVHTSSLGSQMKEIVQPPEEPEPPVVKVKKSSKSKPSSSRKLLSTEETSAKIKSKTKSLKKSSRKLQIVDDETNTTPTSKAKKSKKSKSKASSRNLIVDNISSEVMEDEEIIKTKKKDKKSKSKSSRKLNVDVEEDDSEIHCPPESRRQVNKMTHAMDNEKSLGKIQQECTTVSTQTESNNSQFYLAHIDNSEKMTTGNRSSTHMVKGTPAQRSMANPAYSYEDFSDTDSDDSDVAFFEPILSRTVSYLRLQIDNCDDSPLTATVRAKRRGTKSKALSSKALASGEKTISAEKCLPSAPISDQEQSSETVNSVNLDKSDGNPSQSSLPLNQQVVHDGESDSAPFASDRASSRKLGADAEIDSSSKRHRSVERRGSTGNKSSRKLNSSCHVNDNVSTPVRLPENNKSNMPLETGLSGVVATNVIVSSTNGKTSKLGTLSRTLGGDKEDIHTDDDCQSRDLHNTKSSRIIAVGFDEPVEEVAEPPSTSAPPTANDPAFKRILGLDDADHTATDTKRKIKMSSRRLLVGVEGGPSKTKVAERDSNNGTSSKVLIVDPANGKECDNVEKPAKKASAKSDNGREKKQKSSRKLKLDDDGNASSQKRASSRKLNVDTEDAKPRRKHRSVERKNSKSKKSSRKLSVDVDISEEINSQGKTSCPDSTIHTEPNQKVSGVKHLEPKKPSNAQTCTATDADKPSGQEAKAVNSSLEDASACKLSVDMPNDTNSTGQMNAIPCPRTANTHSHRNNHSKRFTTTQKGKNPKNRNSATLSTTGLGGFDDPSIDSNYEAELAERLGLLRPKSDLMITRNYDDWTSDSDDSN